MQSAKKKRNPLEYGGDHYKTRYGRSRPRPLSYQHTMHLILRSTKAVGPRSFRQPRNYQRIEALMEKFSERFGVEIVVEANNHNHLHFQILLRRRLDYVRFIRALTGAIAVVVGGKSRWRKIKGKFWDRRPYTRIAVGMAAAERLFRYALINRMEALGVERERARAYLLQRLPGAG